MQNVRHALGVEGVWDGEGARRVQPAGEAVAALGYFGDLQTRQLAQVAPRNHLLDQLPFGVRFGVQPPVELRLDCADAVEVAALHVEYHLVRVAGRRGDVSPRHPRGQGYGEVGSGADNHPDFASAVEIRAGGENPDGVVGEGAHPRAAF